MGSAEDKAMRGGLANLNHNVNTTHSSAPIKSAVATIASSCDATFCEGWQRQDSVLYRDYGTSHSASICAFQLEGTLILTDGDQNWTLFNNNVKTRLAKLFWGGSKIVVFAHIDSNMSAQQTQDKLDAVQQELGIKWLAVILTADSVYRKPLPTCWEILQSHFNGGIVIDLAASRYCANAAGRVPPAVSHKDMNDADVKLARNIGVSFYTPEQMFEAKKAAPYNSDTFAFDPRRLGKSRMPELTRHSRKFGELFGSLHESAAARSFLCD